MRRFLIPCVLISSALWLPSAAVARPGDLDPTFSRDGYVRVGFGDEFAAAEAIALDSQGRIVVAGTTGPATEPGEVRSPSLAVARLTPEGVLDRTFAGDGRASFDVGAALTVGDIALDGAGRIVVGGSSGGDLIAVRLLADGSPDASFSSDGVARADAGADESGARLLAGADGSATVGGSSCDDDACRFALARFDAAGGPDAGFDGDGTVVTAFPGDYAILNDLAAAPDGGVLAAGDNAFQYHDAALARYTPSGALDPGFNAGGRALISENTQGAQAVALDPAGRILGLGGFGRLYRILPEAAIDPGFGGAYLPREALALDGHERALAAGAAGGCGRGGCSPVDTAIARADAETGAVDSGFGGARFGHWVLVDIDAKPDGARAITADGEDRPLTAGYAGDELAVARFESADGPPDLDGDGVLDSDDRCPTAFSHRADGCPRSKRRLTMHRSKGTDLWAGRIKSREDRCNERQEIRIYRKRRGDAADELLKIVTSKDGGRWSAKGTPRRGAYFARVQRRFKPRFGICVKARSHAVEIRRGRHG
jgi:uncharacterized delta-60 repeat protein